MMKIIDVKTAIVTGTFDWVLVKVFTNEGTIGLGESHCSIGSRDAVKRLKNVIINENPNNVDKLYQKMYRYAQGFGDTAGCYIDAISGIETALWDIVGKELKTPVYQLLGGKFRDKIRIYADSHASGEFELNKDYFEKESEAFKPEGYAEKAKKVVSDGFTALKFDVDLPTSTGLDEFNRCLSNDQIKLMVKLVEAARNGAGESVDLGIDVHWQYNTNDVIKLAKKLKPYNLMWLEDPVPPENVDAMLKVTNTVDVPICTGEKLSTRYGFKDLLTRQAIDIVAPDIQKAGGLLESKRISDLASIYYIPVAPHCVTSPVGTMASVHTCASMANFLVLEYHSYDLPWWNDLIKGPKPLIKQGYIEVPERPGLGIELNEEVVRAHVAEYDERFFND